MILQDIYIKFVMGKSPFVRHALADDGTLIEFYTFDESFVHHVLYVITCAKDRRPMCLGKTDVFKSFAMKLYERYGSMMACCMIASYQHYN